MRSRAFRIISLIVLLAVVSMFAGLENAVSAAPVVKAEKSCCGGCGQDENQEQDNSPAPIKSEPGCPAFLCLSVDVVEPVTTMVVSLETIPVFTFVPDPIPDPFIKSIFHPPSLV